MTSSYGFNVLTPVAAKAGLYWATITVWIGPHQMQIDKWAQNVAILFHGDDPSKAPEGLGDELWQLFGALLVENYGEPVINWLLENPTPEPSPPFPSSQMPSGDTLEFQVGGDFFVPSPVATNGYGLIVCVDAVKH